MKKTYILACALLAPSVLAEALPSSEVTTAAFTSSTPGNAAITWTATEAVGTTLDNWMISFTLTSLSNTQSCWAAVGTAQANGTTPTSSLSLTILNPSASNKHFGFTYGGTSSSTVASFPGSPTLAATAGHTYHYAYDSATTTLYLADVTEGTMISMDISGVGQFNSVTKQLISGTAWSWTNNKAHLYDFDTVSNMDAASALGSAAFAATVAATDGKVHTGAIPEPTTATLSLLALAGLAARRRRK